MSLSKPFWTLLFFPIVLALFACTSNDEEDEAAVTTILLSVLGSYESSIFDGSGAEIVAHDASNQRLFVVNSGDTAVDVLDIRDPSTPILIDSIDASAEGGAANSVAVNNGLVAVAIQATPKTDAGKVVFYDSNDLSKQGEAAVGALPDMVVFTADGSKVLVANEGEPSDDYLTDPAGSVSIIDLSAGVASAVVSTADFSSFDGSEANLRAQGIRIFGPNASASKDFEPEYIALAADGKTAWVTLQENNAVAEVDITTSKVTAVLPLGLKNHANAGNELDASNKDDTINITNWPVFGMYQPDAIAAFSANGANYYITANEGDARDYATWTEEFRIADLKLNAAAFPDASIQDEDKLGRLRVTSTLGVSNGCDPSAISTDVEADCEYSALHAFGTRSFSIWDTTGTMVYDSGSDLENLTAAAFPEAFNSSNDSNQKDDRSDDKGPEPEGVTTGIVDGKTYAFIGLERIGGIMVYDISKPAMPDFVQYINNRDFTVADEDIEDGSVGDLGPEGLLFIPAIDSPTNEPLLVVGNEVSGTTTLYRISSVEP